MPRSVLDGHQIANELAERRVKLNIGGSIHDPTDPMGKLLFNVLAMIALFSVGRSTVYRPLERARKKTGTADS